MLNIEPPLEPPERDDQERINRLYDMREAEIRMGRSSRSTRDCSRMRSRTFYRTCGSASGNTRKIWRTKK